MEERLPVESNVVPVPKSAADLRNEAAVALGTQGIAEATDPANLSQATRELIARVLDHTEPLDEAELTHQMPRYLNPATVQMVLLRAGGFSIRQIAQILQKNKIYVHHLLRHPHARKIIHAIVPEQAARVIDIRTRLEKHASDLLDHVTDLALESEEVESVAKVTFGMLDRAGYGAVQKSVGVSATPQDLGSAPARSLDRLAQALGESTMVDSVVMPGWRTPVPPGGAVSAGGRPSAQGLPSGSPSRSSVPPGVSQQPQQPPVSTVPPPGPEVL